MPKFIEAVQLWFWIISESRIYRLLSHTMHDDLYETLNGHDTVWTKLRLANQSKER